MLNIALSPDRCSLAFLTADGGIAECHFFNRQITDAELAASRFGAGDLWSKATRSKPYRRAASMRARRRVNAWHRVSTLRAQHAWIDGWTLAPVRRDDFKLLSGVKDS